MAPIQVKKHSKIGLFAAYKTNGNELITEILKKIDFLAPRIFLFFHWRAQRRKIFTVWGLQTLEKAQKGPKYSQICPKIVVF